ncbi:MAG: S8 family peptidase [Acidimicrobiales bacterium]
MAEDRTSDAPTRSREFQLAGAAADKTKPKLPPGVGAIRNPSPGRRYLFRPDELLCLEAEVDAGLDERVSKIASRVDGAQPFQPRPRKGLSEPKLHMLELRADEQEALAAEALAGAGLVKFKVDRKKVNSMLGGPQQLPDIVDLVRSGGGLDEGQPWQCWPNHLLTCQDYPEWGPGGPVKRLTKPFVVPKVVGDAGRGVTVAIVDTGVRKDHVWLLGQTECRDIVDEEALDLDNNDKLDYEAGHGTFIAGIVRQMAPGADIIVRGAVHSNGTVEDAVVAGSIYSLRTEKRVDILNLSLGGYTHMNEGNGLPATTWALKELRRKFPRCIVVAAAGNDHRSDPFYPAALGNVIGVGALNAKGGKARFSNYGWWVDAWALGVDVVSSFVGRDLDTLGGGGKGNDAASWSGTSFAAPRVAGALAASISPGSGS